MDKLELLRRAHRCAQIALRITHGDHRGGFMCHSLRRACNGGVFFPSSVRLTHQEEHDLLTERLNRYRPFNQGRAEENHWSSAWFNTDKYGHAMRVFILTQVCAELMSDIDELIAGGHNA